MDTIYVHKQYEQVILIDTVSHKQQEFSQTGEIDGVPMFLLFIVVFAIGWVLG